MINEMLEFVQEVIYKTELPGSWVSGLWVPGTQSSETIKAIIQPLREEELKFAPEGFRADNSIKVKVDDALLIQAIIEVDDKEYRVILGKHHRNIFPHYVYHCLEVKS